MSHHTYNPDRSLASSTMVLLGATDIIQQHMDDRNSSRLAYPATDHQGTMDRLTLWPGATWQEGDYGPYVARENYIGVPFLECLKPFLHLENLEIAARLD